jgi:RHS repeat-associated protein
LWQDSKALIGSYVDWLKAAVGQESETMAFIHSNHLNAPEAATDKTGQLIWQASYAPFGAVQNISVRSEPVEGKKSGGSDNNGNNSNSNSNSNSNFTLNIRLPGQYFDQESGLHYNRQRYYDPSQGTYLSPDPLGNPDGPNAYAYAANNPITNVDPDGLILFAFDGTGNTNNQADLNELGNGLSNVWRFHELYADGNRRYVTGVGTRHRETDPQFGRDIALYGGNVSVTDMGLNNSGPMRIERMVAYFNAEMELERDNSKMLDIDVIGFSRGAAQARDFANRINRNTTNGQYNYTVLNRATGVRERRCQMINFRFLGLWDTVLSTNDSGVGYNLAIVPGFQYVAHAIALNEYRGDTFRKLPNSTGAFPLESIMGNTAPNGQERVEMGFIGAHADIGGGFRGQEDGLPLVALNWMVEQARNIGVRMSNPPTQIRSNILHDKSDNQYCLNGPGCDEDRQVIYTNGTTTTQRLVAGTTMTHGNTRQFINYYPSTIVRGNPGRLPQADASTGTVDMARYLQWLRANRYEIGSLSAQ